MSTHVSRSIVSPVVVVPTNLPVPGSDAPKTKKKAATGAVPSASRALRPSPAQRQQTLQDMALSRVKELEQMNQTLAEALSQTKAESERQIRALELGWQETKEQLEETKRTLDQVANHRTLESQRSNLQSQEFQQQVMSLEAHREMLIQKVKCAKKEKEAYKLRLKEAEAKFESTRKNDEERFVQILREMEQKLRESEANQAVYSSRMTASESERESTLRKLMERETEVDALKREITQLRGDLLDAQAKTVVLEEVTRAMKDLQQAAIAKQVEVEELQLQLRNGRLQMDELKEAIDRRDMVLQNTQELKEQIREKNTLIDAITLELDQERAARRRENLAQEEECSRLKKAAQELARELDREERLKLAAVSDLTAARDHAEKLECSLRDREHELRSLQSRVAELQEDLRAAVEKGAQSEEQFRMAQRRAYQYRQENHVLLGQYEAWLRATLAPTPAPPAPALNPLQSLDFNSLSLARPAPQTATALANATYNNNKSAADASPTLSAAANASSSPHVGIRLGGSAEDTLGGLSAPFALEDNLAKLIEEKAQARRARQEKLSLTRRQGFGSGRENRSDISSLDLTSESESEA